MTSGVTYRTVIADLIVRSAEHYARVLPSNLSKAQREMAVAGFKDGMRTLARHLTEMGVITIHNDQ